MEEKSLEQIMNKDALSVFTRPEGLDPFIEKVRQEVESHEYDLTTKKGRDEIKSLAAKVASTKVYLDKVGKDLVSDWKAKSKLVDNSRKSMREELDALKVQARKPLTDWEAKEEARLQAEADRLKKEEDHELALEQNELFDLRRERDLRLAAERAAKEKELQEKLERERQERIQKEAELRAEQIKQEAKRKQLEAEEKAKQAELEAQRQKERAKIMAEQARKRERERIEEEKRIEEERIRKIEANKRRVGAVRKEIANELIQSCNIDESTAKKVVAKLASMQRIKINYEI